MEEFPARSFSSRLPLSPPPRRVVPCDDSGVEVRRRNLEVPMEREGLEVLRLRKELPAVAEEGRRSVEAAVVSPVGVARQPREILV